MNPIRSGSDEIAMAQASQLLKNILNVGNGVQTNSKDLTNLPYKSVMNMAEDLSPDRQSAYESASEKTDYQEISFFGAQNEEETFKVTGQQVTVLTNPGQHSSSSNRVKIQNVVDFVFEQKYHMGHLVAAHVSGQYIAFSLIALKTGAGVVRVMSPKTNQRELIKGMRGHVKDLAFAHSRISVVLACIDEYGTLLVNEITQQDNMLLCTLMLRIDLADAQSSDHHLVFWCPYIPESSEDLDEDAELVSKLLAVTHNNEAEIFNASVIAKKYGPGPILSKEIPSNLRIKEHMKPITAVVFSPDGTALATASLDGVVKFFEVKLEELETTPRCLHQWIPHDGKPISCLFFLDNYKSPNPDVQLWKYALTGTDFNQELKLWSCESWECFQTLKFKPSSIEVHAPCLKVEMDPSAGYFVLSDISNKVVYALQICQDLSQHGEVRVCSIARFPLTQPVLSLAIVDANFCRFKPLTGEVVEMRDRNDNERNGESESKEPDDKIRGISIKLWWINTKSLQKSHITYHSPVMLPQHADDNMSIHSQDSVVLLDRLSDISQDLLVDSDISKPFIDVDLPLRRDATSTPVVNNNTTPHSVAVGSSFNNSAPSNTSGSALEILLTPDHFSNSSSRVFNNSTVSPASTALTQTTNSVSPTEDLGYKSASFSKPLATSELKLISFPPESDAPLPTNEVEGANTVLPLVRRKSSQVSSTSSPSQEVADILSPIKSESLTEGRSSCSPKLLSSSPVNNNSFLPTMNNLGQTNVESRKSQSPLSTWPPVPEIKGYKMAGSPLLNNVNHVPVNYVNMSSMSGCSAHDKYPADTEFQQMLQKIQDTQSTINQSLSSLMGAMGEQASKLQRLGESVTRLQSDKLQEERTYAQSQQELFKRIEKMEGSLGGRFEKVNAQHAVATQKKLELLLTKQWETERKILEKQAADISQAATLSATSQLADHVHHQIKAAVAPEVTKFLESFRQQVFVEHNQRLAASEASLKENLTKLVKSKVFVDNLSSSVASSLQLPVQQVCRDILQAHLLPTVERVCQNLFIQLNDTFKNGTRDYLSQAERFLESSSAKHSQAQSLHLQKELKEQSIAITTAQQQHTTHLRDNLDKTISGSFQNFSNDLVQRLRPVVSEEIQGALDAADKRGLFAASTSGMVDSRVVTPLPKMDLIFLRTQILAHLEKEQYNEAFQMALRATDISLVNMTIEQVPPKKVFGVGNPLKLPVLLSLLNQLGSSLDNNTELKIEYLELAVIYVDTNDASNRDKQWQVLRTLKEKLQSLGKSPLSADLYRRLRMLNMCVDGLVHHLEE